MIADRLEFKGHPCFKEHWSGFPCLQLSNVIIGRNNTGKSQLLDLIEAACEGTLAEQGWELRLGGLLDKQSLGKHFVRGTTGGILGGSHWEDHGLLYSEQRVRWESGHKLKATDSIEFLAKDFDPRSQCGGRSADERLRRLKVVLSEAQTVFDNHHFLRLSADRDVRAEAKNVMAPMVTSAGEGATNLIRHFLLTSDPEFPESLVKQEVLAALNQIFGPDGTFTRIDVKDHDTGVKQSPPRDTLWEVYLEEKGKGLVPLSKSGSGLKTVLLVLTNLLLMPKVLKCRSSDCVFAFEELENNIHPTLLRRLMAYIADYVARERAYLFLTTHSPVVLEFWSGVPDSQIVRVVHNGTSARTEPVKGHFALLDCMSDIGARPSDLLQANGVIWVEGPSDRLYVNKWISLYSHGKLSEGRHYQCAFYGGALLAKLQAVSPQEAQDDFVNLIRINPNVVLICDGDQPDSDAPLKERVERLKAEVGQLTTLSAWIWVTRGREIENYLAGRVLSDVLDKQGLPDPKPNERVVPPSGRGPKSYIYDNTGRKTYDKFELALKACKVITLDDMKPRLDWEEAMGQILRRIRIWNGIDPTHT